MSTHNICFRGEIRKILCGYPLLSVAKLTYIYIYMSQLDLHCLHRYWLWSAGLTGLRGLAILDGISATLYKRDNFCDFLFHTNHITKTCLYNFDPLKSHFYIVKLGFTGVYIIFLISVKKKHRLWVFDRTA